MTRQGINGFFDSPEARRACCRVRKVVPFKRAIAGYAAWVTGVRREQSKTRAQGQSDRMGRRIRPVQGQPAARLDRGAGLGVHPRARAAVQQLHESIPSIGCAPCTRAIMPGERPSRRPLVVGAARVSANAACIRELRPAALAGC